MKLPHSIPLLFIAAVTLSACGGGEPETAADEAAVDEAMPEATAAEPAVSLPRTPSPDGARVFFITPSDGETVSSPVSIEFGIEGMTVVAAGDATPHSGHHHLIVNGELPDLSMPIPATETYIHFGDGSTSTEITLEPGTHTLQLLLGDHLHIPHDPPVTSETITITVE